MYLLGIIISIKNKYNIMLKLKILRNFNNQLHIIIDFKVDTSCIIISKYLLHYIN